MEFGTRDRFFCEPRISSMRFLSFGRLFGKRLGSLGRRIRKPRRWPQGSRAALGLEALEERTLLSNVPLPNILSHTDISSWTVADTSQHGKPQSGAVDHNTPSIAYDPSDPAHLKMVATWTN